MIAAVGRATISFISHTGDMTLFVSRAFHDAFSPPFRTRHYLDQMRRVGVDSMPLANLTALFVGMVIALQTGYQLTRFGAKYYSAGVTAVALTREMIPVFIAMVVGARVASSMAAELGTMKVTEQIDAMQALAVSPFKYLAAPRILSSLIMLPIITIYANLVGLFGALVIGTLALGITPRLFYNYALTFVELSDVFSGLVKSLFFGALIGVIGCFAGFHASAGAEGVGRATTRAVVLTLVLILIFDYILTTWTMLFTGLMGSY